jgi:hypothetical protein
MIARWGWVLGMGALLGALSWATWQPLALAWPAALPCYLGAAALWGALLWARARGAAPLTLPQVLGGALAFRLLLLASAPFFSDDIWRYLWDGHVQLHGINPYQYAPADPALAALRHATWAQINHPEVPTIYPPVAQGVFALAQALGGGPLMMRLCVVAAELAMLPAVWRLTAPQSPEAPAQAHERRATVALWLLWSPLMIVEFAGSGHLDALAISPLVWALALLAPRGQRAPTRWQVWALAGALIGLSTNAKLLGLLALPPALIWAWWPRGAADDAPLRPDRARLGRAGALLGACALCVALTAAPYKTRLIFDEPGDFTRGLSTYARKWRANDGLFALAEAAQARILTLAPGPLEGDRPHWRLDALEAPLRWLEVTQEHEGQRIASTTFTRSELALALTKGLVALILAALLALCLVQRRSPSATVLIVLMALLLWAPTVHPWYVAWLVPLAVAHRAHGALLWSALVLLAYTAALRYALDGVWHESALIRVLEYAPVILWTGRGAWRRLRGDEAGAW